MEEQKIILLKKQESFKLTVTRELEKKIRFLCDKLPRNEWSGTLFYTVEGSFANGDLHIIAKDFFLQDVGEAAYTEFKNDVDLAGYMAVHELWDCYTGLMHSHDTMSTFFSGTDLGTLKSEGNDANHFVSLIVNNAGTYTAAITKKVTYLSKGKSVLKYNTFDNVAIEDEGTDFEREETVIEYYPLDIIKEEVPQTPKSELELRLEEVRANANSYVNRKVITTPTVGVTKPYTPSNFNNKNYSNLPHIEIPSIKEERETAKQLELFGNSEMGETKKEVEAEEVEEKKEYTDLDMSIAYDDDHVNPEIVLDTVTQVVTGDIFSIYKQNIDIDKWAANMEKLYNRRFGDITNEAYADSFDYWVDTFTEFLENELFDENFVEKGRDYMDAIWAFDVITKLQDLPKNKYLDKFIESFERWLI